MTDASMPTIPCLCATIRRASRALSQVYENALRPVGLRGSQFTILQALARTGEITQGRLGQILAMDSTTLTRTLKIMGRNGWIAKQPGKDRREWRIRLSKAGHIQFQRATPYWEKVQTEMRDQLGDRWDGLMKLTNDLTDKVMERGDLS
jgi:DNA-binding MarR family transcriptional regulator